MINLLWFISTASSSSTISPCSSSGPGKLEAYFLEDYRSFSSSGTRFSATASNFNVGSSAASSVILAAPSVKGLDGAGGLNGAG